MEAQELGTIGQIYLDVMRATHRGVVPALFLNSLSIEYTLQRFEGILKGTNAFCFVAIQGDKIVGFAMGSLPDYPPDGFDGELNTIYVLPEYQHSGVGKKLFHSVVEQFKHYNNKSMFLTVFKDNLAARKWYETLDGKHIKDYLATISGQELWITIYGWSDLSVL